MSGLGNVEDRGDGLLLRRVDKPAGEDDEHIGRVEGRLVMSKGDQTTRERVRVGLVFRAPEREDEKARARGRTQR